MKSLVKLFLLFNLLFIPANRLLAEGFCVNQAVNSRGEWQGREVNHREAVVTDKVDVKSAISMDVPGPGRYQLLAYVHHNWRKYSPCIYLEARDAEGKTHNGGACIENCWYFQDKEPGRWFMVSLTGGEPYWVLPKGKLEINFFMKGEKGIWDKSVVDPEGEVAIADFFLFPIAEERAELFIPGVVYPETGDGNWQTYEYNPEYATDLIITDKPGSLWNIKTSVYASGYYLIWISAMADSDGPFRIRIRNGKSTRWIKVSLKKTDNWSLVPVGPLFLEKGECTVSFQNCKTRVLIDYFLLMPLADDLKV